MKLGRILGGLVMSFNKWKKIVIGDHIKVKHGYAFKGKYFSDEETPNILVTPGNFKIGGGFKEDKLKYYNGEIPDDYILKPDDLIITMTDLSKAGDTLGYTATVPHNPKRIYLHNQRIGKVIFNSLILDKEFLNYRLRNRDYQKYIVNNSTGTTVKHTAPKTIEKFEIDLPPVEEQKRIAGVLSCLDEKIEVNNQINKTLENMAQAIFKQWFVDFEFPNEDGEPYQSSGGEMVESELGMIPKGWEVGILKDVVKVIDNRGKTPPQEPGKTDYPIIDVKPLSGDGRIINYDNCLKFVNRDTYENWFRSGHPEAGDLLLSTVGSLAELKIFMGRIGCIAQNVVALRMTELSNLYMYELLKYIKKDLISYNIGSVQPSIKITHVVKHKIIIPNKEELDSFDEIARNITEEINNKYIENDRLKIIRDLMLPKLMSGEIRVPLDSDGEAS